MNKLCFKLYYRGALDASLSCVYIRFRTRIKGAGREDSVTNNYAKTKVVFLFLLIGEFSLTQKNYKTLHCSTSQFAPQRGKNPLPALPPLAGAT